MEPITLLLAVLGVYGTAIATKAGQETFDATRQLLKHKLTGTPTGEALNEGKDPDPRQAVIDVEAIAQDAEIEQLLLQIQQLLSQNEELKKQKRKRLNIMHRLLIMRRFVPRFPILRKSLRYG